MSKRIKARAVSALSKLASVPKVAAVGCYLFQNVIAELAHPQAFTHLKALMGSPR
jgi:hypothetical protein